ncbi:MAG: tetratricopeptide repeat protein [Verrucomicrobia bacterium]|nr:tetratricopeptide repeat protein [Verrucomicrobiota bacterium]MCH8528097.1 tetratricopeptide repeat protein [Kiritimatiellia bacterium]
MAIPHTFNRFQLPFLPRALLIAAFLATAAGCRQSAERLEPEALLEQARDEMLVFNFDNAKRLLNHNQNYFPKDHSDYPEFLYLQALANWHVVPPVPQDVVRAGILFEQLIREFPDHPLIPSALLLKGRLHDIRNFAGDEPDYEKARAAYQALLNRFPDHDLAGDALVRLAMTHVKQVDRPEEIQKGIDMVATWLDENPDSRHTSLLALFLGTMNDQFIGDRALGLRYYKQAYEIGFVNPGRAGVNTWRLVELAIEAGMEAAGHEVPAAGRPEWDLTRVEDEHLHIAIEAAQTIIRDFPRSGRGYEAVLLLRDIQTARPDLDFDIPTLQLFDLSLGEDNV